MTGFARREGALEPWSWAVEARSVNGRNLEVRFRAPPGFDGLERAAREAAQVRFQRGQVNVNVQARRAGAVRDVSISREMIERYLAIGADLVASGRAAPPAMDGLLALPGVVLADDGADDAETRAAVEAAIAIDIALAFDALQAARGEEGAALTGLITGFIDRIDSLARAADREAAGQSALVLERLGRRLAELAADAAPPERIVQEAALIATKADVREELDRLAAHVIAARGLAHGAGASGRRLDFLTQEFMREANTLCSKSAAIGLTAIGLDLKAAIDQLREQVQNVE